MPTFSADRDQINRPEHREMFGDLGLGQPQSIDKVADGGLFGAKGIEELSTAAFRHSVERVSRRRSSGHNAYYMLISTCVNF